MLCLVDFCRVASIWFLLGFSHRVCVSSVVSISNQHTNWLSLGKYNRETSLAPKRLVVQVVAATALAPSADLRQGRRRTQTSSTAGERLESSRLADRVLLICLTFAVRPIYLRKNLQGVY